MPYLDEQRAIWLAEHVLPHEPALRAWLVHRMPRGTGSGFEIDDVVQEAYAVLATLGGVAHIRDPRAYLYTVAQSVILQHVRRASIVSIEMVAEIDSADHAGDERSPDRCAAASEELRRVGRLIAGLPDKCRQAFVLRKVHGLSQRQIAASMGISESTVEKHIGKGVRLLAAAMARAHDDGPGERPVRNERMRKDHGISSRPE